MRFVPVKSEDQQGDPNELFKYRQLIGLRMLDERIKKMKTPPILVFSNTRLPA